MFHDPVEESRPKAAEPRNPWLYALPGAVMPDEVTCAGQTYRHEHTFKHDFFAATGLYRSGETQVVLKLNRVSSCFGIPLEWIGRYLADHEAKLYRAAHDLPGVPALVGRVGTTGLLHDFVPGAPLGRRDAVAETFFEELQALIDALHDRDIAYVDLNKRQNIIHGSDGRPYLIDFQISLMLARRAGLLGQLRHGILRRFQNADRYHVLKHKRRLREDQLTSDERKIVEHLSIWIKLHRLIARPLTQLRRRILRVVRGDDAQNVAGGTAK